MTTLHNNLQLVTLTPKGFATSGYWYLVQENSFAHTAFKTEEGLRRWLKERGLSLTEKLVPAGVFSTQKILGQYRNHICLEEADVAAFNALNIGERTRVLSNGAYTEAVLTTDYQGIRTVQYLNPNVRDRVVYDYAESTALYS